MSEFKVGIIGTGSMAAFHARALLSQKDVRIIAVSDINAGRAAAKARDFGADASFERYQDLLAMDELDAVCVTTWNHTHEPITLDALNAGKHVLCEKPPALNTAGAVRMLETARANGRILMYGMIRRFAENARLLGRFLKSGDLGQIYYVRAISTRRCGNPGGWFIDRSFSGGGPLIDLGIHLIDLAIDLMGDPEPICVFGQTNDRIGDLGHISGFDHWQSADARKITSNVEDFATATIRFANGADLHLETSWVLHARKGETTLSFFGDKGGATLEPVLEVYQERHGYLVDVTPVLSRQGLDFEMALRDEMANFVASCRGQEACRAPAEAGVKVMRIIDAVYQSAKSGKLIEL